MNIHRLNRLYDQLTPRERLPLLMAAHLRSDMAEQQRLNDSAPKQVFRVVDYYCLAKAFGEAVHLHLQYLMDLAGSFWQCWGLWMISTLAHVPDKTGKKRRRKTGAGAKKHASAVANGIDESHAFDLMCNVASRFTAHVDGWKQFCADLHLDPEAALRFRIGWELIEQTERAARILVLSAEEAARSPHLEPAAAESDDSSEGGAAPVESVADLARDWHAVLDDLVRSQTVE
jgi:hypothetical protein